MSKQVLVVCPACDGSGTGSGGIPGPLGGRVEGICGSCLGNGEVTWAKREHILAYKVGKEAQAKLDAIIAHCWKQADEHNRQFGMGVWPQDMKVDVRDIFAIIGYDPIAAKAGGKSTGQQGEAP